jgi:hypothetical protein
MAHNFRIEGDMYVSKRGNDSNDGLTPATPKRTINQAIAAAGNTKTIVIGAGYYKEAVWTGIAGRQAITLIGDGEVILMGNGSNQVQSTEAGINTTYNSFVNITFRDYQSVRVLVAQGTDRTHIFTNCKFLCNTEFDTLARVVFTNCIFINSIGTHFSTGNVEARRCIFINSTLPNLTAYLDNYLDSNSSVSMRSTVAAINFNYNNLQGLVIMNQPGAVSGADANGLALPYQTHREEYPTFNTQSINLPPLFNDVARQDFSLQASSPHIRRGSMGVNNIGGTSYGVGFYAGVSSEVVNAEKTSNIIGTNDLTMNSVPGPGTITITAKVSDLPRYIGLLRYLGALTFNSNASLASVENRNVPNANNVSSGDASNPNRLTFEMRWTDSLTVPTTDQGWDNGGIIEAGNYEMFEWNRVPKIDASGNGNGRSAHNINSAAEIKAVWIQVRVTIWAGQF